MKVKYIYLFGLLLVELFACQSEVNSKSAEQTVRDWQSYVDANNLKAVRELSTDATMQMLDDMEKAFGAEPMLIKTNFLKIECIEQKEDAKCICEFRQDTIKEVYQEIYLLRKINGRWLVDINEGGKYESEDILTPNLSRDSIEKK